MTGRGDICAGGSGAAVAVMAKVPRPGGVKTRIAKRLGAQTACTLHRAFVLDLHDRLCALPHPVFWFYWPDDPRFAALVPAAAAARPQRGANLGRRMANAFAEVFAAGFAPVVMVGADVPHLPLERVRSAAAHLATGADVALGPAEDGGYYLIALTRPRPGLFRGIAWGTERVYDATVKRVEAAGLWLARLPPCFDIDEIGDLERLARLMAGGEIDGLPRTRAALAAAGL